MKAEADRTEIPPRRIIEPSTFFNPVSQIMEVWNHRELLYTLAWRDYKIRYRQTTIGLAWAIFQPLMAMLAFVLIFGRFSELTDNKVPYAIFVYAGLIIWQFFSNSVNESSASLVDSRQMITKIYFPRIIIPLAKIFTQIIDLIPSLIIFAGLMIYFRVFPSVLGVIYMIPLLFLLTITSASVGIILSAINVKFRDVKFIVPYFIQLGLFFSPVIYSTAKFGKYQTFLDLNPMTGIIEAFRSVAFSLPFPTQSLMISFCITLILSISGLYYFIKTEGKFSDVI